MEILLCLAPDRTQFLQNAGIHSTAVGSEATVWSSIQGVYEQSLDHIQNLPVQCLSVMYSIAQCVWNSVTQSRTAPARGFLAPLSTAV